MKMSYAMRTGGHRLTRQFEQFNQVEYCGRQVHKALGQIQLIDAYSNVALEHSLSAPVVATMRANPMFVQAVSNFPESSLYNVVPENKSSARHGVAMESLAEAQVSVVETLSQSAKDLVSSFDTNLTLLPSVISDMRAQVAAAKVTLEELTVEEDEVENVDVDTVDEEALAQAFTTLEENVVAVESFNTDELRANPEKIAEEVVALQQLTDTIGPVVGLELATEGLVSAPKGSDFVPTQGSFKSKGLSKQLLTFYLDRADMLLDQVESLSTKRPELVVALEAACAEMPRELNSTDVQYGASEHITLMTSYTTLVNKLAQESLTTVSNVLAASATLVEALDVPFDDA